VVTQKAADASLGVFQAAFQNAKHLFQNPRNFLSQPTFLFVCLVYTGTYITANSVLTICEFAKKDPTYYKLTATTGVNMTLGILKDRYFAKKFSGKPPATFPISSWMLFVGRDAMTMAAGFILPSIVSQSLQENDIVANKSVANTVAQIGVPITAQILLTPIHLLALDLYMEKGSTPKERFRRILGNAPETITIRMGRVLFAYGIAGVFNIGLRTKLREMFVFESESSVMPQV
jgi:hypothetical protein